MVLVEDFDESEAQGKTVEACRNTCTKLVDRVVEDQSPMMTVSGERAVESTRGRVDKYMREKDDIVKSQQLQEKSDKNNELEEDTRKKEVAFAESCLVEIPVGPLQDEGKSKIKARTWRRCASKACREKYQW